MRRLLLFMSIIAILILPCNVRAQSLVVTGTTTTKVDTLAADRGSAQSAKIAARESIDEIDLTLDHALIDNANRQRITAVRSAILDLSRYLDSPEVTEEMGRQALQALEDLRLTEDLARFHVPTTRDKFQQALQALRSANVVHDSDDDEQ
jgi:hypothetical protein